MRGGNQKRVLAKIRCITFVLPAGDSDLHFSGGDVAREWIELRHRVHILQFVHNVSLHVRPGLRTGPWFTQTSPVRLPQVAVAHAPAVQLGGPTLNLRRNGAGLTRKSERRCFSKVLSRKFGMWSERHRLRLLWSGGLAARWRGVGERWTGARGPILSDN